MDYRTTYMELLLKMVIRIQEGESLSINTNPSHLDFARDLAQTASEITLQPVHVVLIEEGVPGEVFSVTPILTEESSQPPVRSALVRIDDTEDRDWDFTADAADIVKQPALMQKVGNLAPPQMDRQVAPWAIVAVPGPVWARRLLGRNSTEEQLWKQLAPVFKLDTANPLEAWSNHIAMLDRRLATLNRMDVESYEITTAKGTRLTLEAVEESRWRGGVRKLDNGRTFLPLLPLDRVSMLVNRTTSNGIVHTSAPFPLLGGIVEDAVFELSQGSVTSFDAKRGLHLLEAALNIDEGARKLGELSLVEHGSVLQSISDTFGYSGFDENRSATLTLGMGETFHLEALDTYEDELDLQNQTGCNVSDLRARIPIGDASMMVTARMLDGSSEIIMQNGVFLE